MRQVPAIVLAAILATGARAEPAASRAACEQGQIVSLDDLLATHKAILVGDYHGTAEMPAAFADLVAQAAQEGRRIAVALEYPEDWQGDLDAVMAAPDEVTARAAFAGRHTPDGRSSDAMRDMLMSLRQLKRGGADLSIRAVDIDYQSDTNAARAETVDLPPDVNRAEGRRNIIMGLNAIGACQAVDCDLLMMFAGNFHTRLAVSDSRAWNAQTGEITEFREAPAGYLIARAYPAASIFLGHAGGTVTNMMEDGTATREVEPMRPRYAAEDKVIYCDGPEFPGMYFMSVGAVSSSRDCLAPLPEPAAD